MANCESPRSVLSVGDAKVTLFRVQSRVGMKSTRHRHDEAGKGFVRAVLSYIRHAPEGEEAPRSPSSPSAAECLGKRANRSSPPHPCSTIAPRASHVDTIEGVRAVASERWRATACRWCAEPPRRCAARRDGGRGSSSSPSGASSAASPLLCVPPFFF